MLNIVSTPRYRRALKKLKKDHKVKIIKKLEETIKKLANFEITTEQRNHKLEGTDIYDIHIEGDVILLYRYLGEAIIIDLELTDIVNHDELNRKIKADRISDKFMKRYIRTNSMKNSLRQANIDAIEFFIEFEFPFPKGEFLADDWKDLLDGVSMGIDSDFEVAEGIIEYLQKEVDFNNKHAEIFDEDPLADLTLEIYNDVKKEYRKAISY